MAFQKGQSGNPGGRPKLEVAVRDLARQHTTSAINALVDALKAETESVRVSAAQALLDRGWGKPDQTVTNEMGESFARMLDRISGRIDATAGNGVAGDSPEPTSVRH